MANFHLTAGSCCCERSNSAFLLRIVLLPASRIPALDLITHSLAHTIRFRLMMIASGYEDGNDASSLRIDPCSSWRSILSLQTAHCARDRSFRVWKTCPMPGSSCAWVVLWSICIATAFARLPSASSVDAPEEASGKFGYRR